MKLLLMTPPFFFSEEHQILNALFGEGLDVLHLRKPSSEPVFSERLLSLIPKTHHCDIVVHDHFYLQGEYGLRGLHLNQRNPALPPNYKGQISCTCYTLEEVIRRRDTMDYIILSLTTGEGKDVQARFTQAELQEAAKQGLLDRKVYIQGNITLEQMDAFHSWGIGGVVLFGEIWNRFNIYSAQDFKETIAYFRLFRRAAE